MRFLDLSKEGLAVYKVKHQEETKPPQLTAVLWSLSNSHLLRAGIFSSQKSRENL